MKMPRDRRVPGILGLGGLIAGLVLTWLDVPGMWKHLPCFTCQLDFVPQPMVGSYGFLPVFILEQLCIFLFMLWAAQSRPAVVGRIGHYFGRASLQFLLLHGWVPVTLSPVMARFYPTHGNLAVPVALFVFIPALHAFIFNYTESYLNRVLAFCFESGRSVTDWIFGPRARISNG